MKQTLAVKLAPTPDQQAALLATMERFNACCDWLGGVAHRERIANKVVLQKLVYYEAREGHPIRQAQAPTAAPEAGALPVQHQPRHLEACRGRRQRHPQGDRRRRPRRHP
ncbi:MAG: hypothetical protein U0893_09465 [Chloroflexota bacterium]